MGHLRRVHRFEDDDRERAKAEIKRIVSGISDGRLMELFGPPTATLLSRRPRTWASPGLRSGGPWAGPPL